MSWDTVSFSLSGDKVNHYIDKSRLRTTTLRMSSLPDWSSGVNTHHVPGQLVTRQVFDVFIFRVDDLGQLPSIDHLFVNPHVDHGVEAVRRFHIVPDDFGNWWAPVRSDKTIGASQIDRLFGQTKLNRWQTGRLLYSKNSGGLRQGGSRMGGPKWWLPRILPYDRLFDTDEHFLVFLSDLAIMFSRFIRNKQTAFSTYVHLSTQKKAMKSVDTALGKCELPQRWGLSTKTHF